jgi:uncharacterized protein (DUF433 family)
VPIQFLEHPPQPGLYTVAEAAYVVGTSDKVINREIDAEIAELAADKGKGNSERLLKVSSLYYFALIDKIRTHLNHAGRKRIWDNVQSTLTESRAEFVFGDLRAQFAEVKSAIDRRLQIVNSFRVALEAMAGVCGGELVFKRTRVSVRTLSKIADSGDPVQSICREYDVTPDQVELARVFTSLYPKRGRPKSRKQDVLKHARFAG